VKLNLPSIPPLCGDGTIWVTTGQDWPGNAREFICHRNNRYVSRRSSFESVEPASKAVLFTFETFDYGTTSMDEKSTQVGIASLADAEELRFSACGMLSRNQTEPCCQITAFAEGCTVSDRGQLAPSR
jgi:hypothetical protein